MKYSLVKRTEDKNGKPLYYESRYAVEDPMDVSWYRIDNYLYTYYVETFHQTATEVRKDKSDEVTYMVFIK
jgi:hypothetical protein